MLTLISMPQAAEWMIILLIFGAMCVAPVALLVWLIVKIARRRT